MKNTLVEFLCIDASGVKHPVCTTVYEGSTDEAVIAKVYHALQTVNAMHPEKRNVAEFDTKAGFVRFEVVSDPVFLEGESISRDSPQFPDHNATSNPW